MEKVVVVPGSALGGRDVVAAELAGDSELGVSEAANWMAVRRMP